MRKRAQEQHQADLKRAKQFIEEERLAAHNGEELKTIRARQEEATLEARRKVLQQVIVNREDLAARKQIQLRAKVYQRWLQTTYPAILADRCISVFQGISKIAKKNFEAAVKDMYQTKTFERSVWIPPLWKPDNALTTQWVAAKPFTSGEVLRPIRCGEPFEAIIDREAPHPLKARNAPYMLWTFLSKCVPMRSQDFLWQLCPEKVAAQE